MTKWPNVTEESVMESFIGLHILRAGSAISATNLGTSDRLFKKHGRWKSEAVKD